LISFKEELLTSKFQIPYLKTQLKILLMILEVRIFKLKIGYNVIVLMIKILLIHLTERN